MLRESREFTDLIHAVESGDIDVTFTDIGPYETRPLTVRHLLDDPLVFLAPANAPEATQQVVSIADIAHLPMIGTSNVACRKIIDEAFRRAPVSPTYVFRSDDHPTIQGLIGWDWPTRCCHCSRWTTTTRVSVIPIRPRRRGVSVSDGTPSGGRR